MNSAQSMTTPEQAPWPQPELPQSLEAPTTLPQVDRSTATTELVVSLSSQVGEQDVTLRGMEAALDALHPGSSDLLKDRIQEVIISPGLEGAGVAGEMVKNAALNGIRSMLEGTFQDKVAAEQDAHRPEYTEQADQLMRADGTYERIEAEEQTRVRSEASQVAERKIRSEIAAGLAQEFPAQVREAVAALRQSPELAAEIAAERAELFAEQQRQQTEAYRTAFRGTGLDLRELPRDSRVEVRFTQQNVHALQSAAAPAVSSVMHMVSHGEGKYEVLADAAGELNLDELVELGSAVNVNGRSQFRTELRHGGLLTYIRGGLTKGHQVFGGSAGTERVADLLIDGESLMLMSDDELVQRPSTELVERGSAISDEVLAAACRRGDLTWCELPVGTPVTLLTGSHSQPLMPDGTRGRREVVASALHMESLGDGVFAVSEGVAIRDDIGNLYTMPAGSHITSIKDGEYDAPGAAIRYHTAYLRGKWQLDRGPSKKVRPARQRSITVNSILNVDFGDVPVLPYTDRILPKE